MGKSHHVNEPGVWTARGAWVLMPFTVGPCLARALDPTSSPFRTTASVLLWAGWAVALGAALVPRTISLTIVRTAMPAGLVAAGWAALALPGGSPAWVPALGVGWALVAVAACLSPLLGDTFVNGSAYGPERRMALRVPGALLVLAPVTWAVAVAGAGAGPLLLAARVWVPGAVALVAGWPLAFVAVRALHGLSRRWVVFVPAGVVLHDLFGMPDAVLFPRRMIAHLGPAPVGVEALDATQRAPGLALLLELTEPLPIGVREGRQEVGTVDTVRLLFTPTRPGALLAEAEARRIRVD